MDLSLRAHSEAKGEAIQKQRLDCFVALLLAMTRALGQFRRNPLLAFKHSTDRIRVQREALHG
jgi:hypothetical protein